MPTSIVRWTLYEEVGQQGQATPPSPAYVPNPMKLEHHSYAADTSPTTPSPGYVADSDLEEDQIDYAADAEDDGDEEEESSEDDD
ncbi:hypothetical protein Tco_1363941, partial [Tanacetum coccineum]